MDPLTYTVKAKVPVIDFPLTVDLKLESVMSSFENGPAPCPDRVIVPSVATVPVTSLIACALTPMYSWKRPV